MENLKIIEGEVGWDIKLESFKDETNFILNTYGGDLFDGWAGFDYLRSLDNSEVGVVGVCASSGTIILLGAKKRWASPNSQFCIHNPWTMTGGDARDLQKTANDLKAEEDKLVALYVAELSESEEFIRNLMKEDKFIDATEALRIGLIHEIREDNLKPLEGDTPKAMFFNLKKVQMSTVTKEDLKNEFEKQENSLFEKFKNYFSPRIKNLIIKDVNGVELDFDVETEEEIVVGTKVTAKDETYIIEGVGTVVVVGNTVDSIEVMDEESNEEMEALKAENEELKAKLAESETVQNESEVKIENLTKGFEDLKAEQEKFKNTWSKKVNNLAIPDEGDKSGDKKSRSAFKKKE